MSRPPIKLVREVALSSIPYALRGTDFVLRKLAALFEAAAKDSVPPGLTWDFSAEDPEAYSPRAAHLCNDCEFPFLLMAYWDPRRGHIYEGCVVLTYKEAGLSE